MSAHILIIADGRSPTAQSWIANTQALGYSVSLISTFPCQAPEGVRGFHILPVALSRLSTSIPTGSQALSEGTSPKPARSFIRRFTPHLQFLRYMIGPITILRYVWVYQRLVGELTPILVHALRIPFEGMLGSFTPADLPFITSTWGNDLTLHAKAGPLMRVFTKRCLARADGFTADTHRDISLAHEWGLPEDAPTLTVPGSGGLDLNEIVGATGFDPQHYGFPSQSNWVVNPRGLRPGSVHQDVFFAALPSVLAQFPNTVFICPGLAGNHQALAWVDKYALRKHALLLPKLPQPLLWSLLKQSVLYVSPSSHDGTPNSLLEAMACGCFPVVGDIESLREWIDHGINGLLVDPRDPQQLATEIIYALRSEELRQNAASHNLTLIKNRAAQSATRPLINDFYKQFLP